MKKILYSLIAVLAMVMSSCSNDDIEIIKTGGVTFNVSTQGVYDDFEVSDEDINIGISIKKGNTELADKINGVLDTMTTDDYEAMMDEAISVQPLAQ